MAYNSAVYALKKFDVHYWYSVAIETETAEPVLFEQWIFWPYILLCIYVLYNYRTNLLNLQVSFSP